jgi:glycosyltransferase involved in cell wall biosynthesis
MGIRLDSRTPAAAAAPPRSRIPAGEPAFVYLGTLGRERRIDFLLRVLTRVRAEIPQVKLYLVGKGERPEDDEFLAQEARRLGVLPSVVFVGQLPQQEALCYVQDADVCVSPFYPTPILNSTSPTKLVEYMAMGKAVVANTHPEQQLLIDQSGGGYCVPYEEDAFAEAIVTLLRAPDLARAMGERGRRYVIEHRAYGVIATGVEREMLRVAGKGGGDECI